MHFLSGHLFYSSLRHRWKMYKRASDACVNFFLACIKYVSSLMLFCRKSELCCDFVFLGIILMAFNLVSFYFKRNKLNLPHNFCLYIFVAVLFCSYLLSNTFYGVLLHIHFCQNLHTFLVKIVLDQILLV